MSVNIRATGWDDILGDIVVKGSGSNDPTWASLVRGIYAYQFSASVMNECWVTLHVGHDYKPGTNVYLHVHWTRVGTNTGTCRWGFEYSVAKGYNQQAFPTTTTVYFEQAAHATSLTHQIAEIDVGDTIPSTNIEPDSIILVRVFRDAAHVNDTLTDASFLLLCDAHYQTDRDCTPNKNYPFS